MKAQRIFGLDLSWPRVTAVFLIDVAVLALVSHWPGEPGAATYAWWSGVGITALLTIAVLTTYRRVPLTTALAARVLDRFADPEEVLAEGRTTAVDHHRRYSREVVGIREYRDRLVAAIAVSGPAVVSSGRHHRTTAPTVVLPVDLVAAELRQFDVRLDGIDIVSVQTRSAAGDDGPTAEDEPETPDAHSVPDHRNTWLVLRMDPQCNVAAVAARDSVAATLAAAAERLAHHLDGRHITARVLTAEEFADVDTAVLAGLQPTRIRQRRRRLKQSRIKGYVTSFWVSPQDITSENLEQLWLPEIETTVVTVRLIARHGGAEVSVLVRHHSGGRLPKDARTGLNRLTGRQLTAVRTSLPTPMRRVLAVPARALHAEEQLTVPLEPAAAHPVVPVGAEP